MNSIKPADYFFIVENFKTVYRPQYPMIPVINAMSPKAISTIIAIIPHVF